MKIILIIGLSMLFLLTGCMNNYHSFDFDSTSTSSCAVECEDLMNEYSCWEASPSYNERLVNGKFESGKCSCYIRTCRE